MTNNSSTGGYLAPTTPPAPLEGQALNRFLQQWVVGITGMDGTLVRPRWQAEPPNIPAAATAWAAIGINTAKADKFPYVEHDPTLASDQGADILKRQEEFEMLCSFYDLGTNGQADELASLLRDGTAIAQNREALTLADMSLASVGDMLTVPSLLKQRWLYRVDLIITIRRQITRVYPILNIESASGTVETPDITVTFNA